VAGIAAIAIDTEISKNFFFTVFSLDGYAQGENRTDHLVFKKNLFLLGCRCGTYSGVNGAVVAPIYGPQVPWWHLFAFVLKI
jgi:hypothetical protein